MRWIKKFKFQIDQLQLGLPSRDYFLDAESDRDLNAYHTYMTEVSHLLGKAVNNKDTYKWLKIKLELASCVHNALWWQYLY